MPQKKVMLDFQQYESLVDLARRGALWKGTVRAFETDPTLRPLWEKARSNIGDDRNVVLQLEDFLKSIEDANGITRYIVVIRWTEAGQPLPPRITGAPTRFPENWPPELEGTLELLTRPVSRSDADQFLENNAIKPIDVMCTSDPGRRVGWTPIDEFFR